MRTIWTFIDEAGGAAKRRFCLTAELPTIRPESCRSIRQALDWTPTPFAGCFPRGHPIGSYGSTLTPVRPTARTQ